MRMSEIGAMKKELVEYGLENVIRDVQNLSIVMLYRLVTHDTEWVEVDLDIIRFRMTKTLLEEVEI